MNLQKVVMAYFLIGSVLWAGGAVPWTDAGVGGLFVDASGTDVATNESVAEDVGNSEGVISEFVRATVGPAVAALRIIGGVLNYLFWPVTTLSAAGAPTELVVLLGGTPTVALFMAVARFVRG